MQSFQSYVILSPRIRARQEIHMNEDNPAVCVIDDESSIRVSLSNPLRSAGVKVQTFTSAQEFLSSLPVEALGCLVLDVHLPGISGLDLQRELGSGGRQFEQSRVLPIQRHHDSGNRSPPRSRFLVPGLAKS
jgi:CheY-like chemotaxis protein